MGLDQYAEARKGEPTINEDGDKEWTDSYELAYWRKHPNLQGFMEGKWEGEGEFNCVDVELTLEDLDDLEETLDNQELPETHGFFFGEDSSEYYAEQDRDFIVSARAAIKQGYTVVYSSWW
mgnify:CR=1 FL=1|tara:strand:- start:654 stop:1016 length:363 start_codon:yes stop_codon:yes gene_type:complete